LVTPAGVFLPSGLDSALAAQAMFPVTMRHEMRGGWYDVAGYAIAPGTSPEDPVYADAGGGWQDVDVHGNPNELATIANDPSQMPEIWQGLMVRLLAKREYRRLFAVAYPQLDQKQLGFQHAANALASFQTATFTLVDTPWDRFLAGERDALADQAVAGALLFYGKAGCSSCHSGSLFSDQAYHNIAVPQFGPGTDGDVPLDYGRWQVTGEERDRFAFRTPTLRSVVHSGPWLHNGAYDSLQDVLHHHLDPETALQNYTGSHLPPELRGTVQNEPVTVRAILQTLDPLLQDPPTLSAREMEQLLAFMQALAPDERRYGK
jgi:cytochrome c peroxidase